MEQNTTRRLGIRVGLCYSGAVVRFEDGDVKRGSDPAAGAERAASHVPASARRARLAGLIEREGFVSVADSAAHLGVSTMTVRRDLLALESRGLLQRTHGGAIATERRRHEIFDAEEPLFERRKRKNAAAKAVIAVAAARQIGPGETIALDVGTSVLALAEALVERADLRIFTNSLPAAITLARSRSPVYLLGGLLRAPEMSVIGPVATAQLGEYYFDRLFLGVSGITETAFFDYSLEDTEVKRAFIARARQVVVLCDSSKFGHRALAVICGIEKCHMLITDAPPPSHLSESLRASSVEIVVAAAERA
jgi:DeoR/GlpR family transcriptional regulator of sugar metabolism